MSLGERKEDMNKLTKGFGIVAAVGLALAGLTGCAPQKPLAQPSKPPSPTQTVDQPKLAEYYAQDLQWKNCGGDFECAMLEVPLDYDNPQGEHAKIAMKRLNTANRETRIGTLIMNPGGPGGSGLENMKPENVAYFFSDTVRNYYDVLGFDPRGVGASQPAIKCRTDQELDEDNSTYYDLSTEAGRAADIADYKALGEKCLKNSPQMTRFASTEYTARDLDIMRAAVGDDRLYYLGFSYGTYLGAIYADLFPSRVGRMVLDGVLDPSLNMNEVSAMQASGFEASLREFVTECQQKHAKQCPLHGDVDAGMAQIKALLDSLKTNPMPAKRGRELTAPQAFTGLIGNMYNTASWWQQLLPALNQALNEADGTGLLNSADYYNERNMDGTYDNNSSDAFVVINSLDYEPVGDMAQWEADAAKLEADYPTVGEFFSYSSLGAENWPVKAKTTAKREVNPPLEEDILLIGTTGDPATPLKMAQHTRQMMDHSKLLTVQGWNHTAYNSYAPGCVKTITDTYLVSGKIEAANSGTCQVD